MKEQNHKKSSLLMLMASMIIFGTIGIFRKYIPLSSGMLAFGRGVIGVIFLLVYIKISGRKCFRNIGKRNLIGPDTA